MAIKRNIKRDLKRIIRLKLYFKLIDNLKAIRSSVMDGFLLIEDFLEDAETNIDFNIIKEIFLERLMKFEFIPESDDPNRLDIVLPTIDNFDFSDIEIMEIILNGVVGDFVEANYDEISQLFGNTHDKLLKANSVIGDFIYIIPTSEDLALQERGVLGYSLNSFPFSNSPPIHREFFSKSVNFIDNNLPDWIYKIIKTSLKDVTHKYGGK